MYYSTMEKSHYEAGFQYGTMLYKNNINPMENILVSEERVKFSDRCLPHYQKFYPEIIDEIQGMADGLKIKFMDIAGFLFSMYCYTFNNNCSCLAISYKNNIFFARNSDFAISIEELCQSAYYHLENVYSFIGNTTAWIEMEDGINEYGLAAGLTFIYPTKIGYGFNAGIIIRMILEKCKSTNEAIILLKELPIASQQTITLADKTGDIAVIECNCEKISVIKPKLNKPYVFTTNHFVSDKMVSYQSKIKDTVHSHERYETLKCATETEKKYSIEFLKDLLSGKHGFMCQYDRKNEEMDTVWASIYDLTSLEIFRAEGNPSRNQFKMDSRLKFK